MFQVYGNQGRVFSGTLEQLRQQHLVKGVARVSLVAPVLTDAGPSTAAPLGGISSGYALGVEAMQAYGQAAATQVRRPLTCAADVMHRPALTVPAEANLREAWLMLVRHGIAQAPVTGPDGVLVGMIGRAELMPTWSMEPPSTTTESTRLSRPVTTVMGSLAGRLAAAAAAPFVLMHWVLPRWCPRWCSRSLC